MVRMDWSILSIPLFLRTGHYGGNAGCGQPVPLAARCAADQAEVSRLQGRVKQDRGPFSRIELSGYHPFRH